MFKDVQFPEDKGEAFQFDIDEDEEMKGLRGGMTWSEQLEMNLAMVFWIL